MNLPHSVLRAASLGIGASCFMGQLAEGMPLGIKLPLMSFSMASGFMMGIYGHAPKELLNRQIKKSTSPAWNTKHAVMQTAVTASALTCATAAASVNFLGKKLEQFTQQAEFMLPASADMMTGITLGTLALMVNEVHKCGKSDKYFAKAEELRSTELAERIDEIGSNALTFKPRF